MTDLEEARALWRLCGDMTLPLTASDRVRIANSFRAVIDMAKRTEEFDAFRQEVSDSVEHYLDQWRHSTPSREVFACQFGSFIIPKPVDPLVEVLADMGLKPKGGYDWASEFRNTLAARGLKIVEDKP